MTTVLKIQRAVMPVGAPWMVYDQHRSFSRIFEPDEAVRKAMGSKLKIYVEGVYNEVTGAVEIVEVLEPRPW